MKARNRTVKVNEYPGCPVCGVTLVRVSDAKRFGKLAGGIKEVFLIPVCKCPNESCSVKNRRVLPEELTPHKHYQTDVIEKVIEGKFTPETLETEDYPSEKTMVRWKDWIDGNRNHIEGILRQTGSRLSMFGAKLLNTEDSLMEQLQKRGNGWLSTINRITWNFNAPLMNARQLAGLTDLGRVRKEADLRCPCQEDNRDESQRSEELGGRSGSEAVQNHSAVTGSGNGSGQKSRAP